MHVCVFVLPNARARKGSSCVQEVRPYGGREERKVACTTDGT